MNRESGFQQCKARDSKTAAFTSASIDKENQSSAFIIPLSTQKQSSKLSNQKALQKSEAFATTTQQNSNKSSLSFKQTVCHNVTQKEGATKEISGNQNCLQNLSAQKSNNALSEITNSTKSSINQQASQSNSEIKNNSAQKTQESSQESQSDSSDSTEKDKKSKFDRSDRSNSNDVSVGTPTSFRQPQQANEQEETITSSSSPSKLFNQTEILININKVISIEAHAINFITTLPGKMLGSTLLVGNLTDSEQIVELAVDTLSLNYSRQGIVNEFSDLVDFAEDLPFSIMQQTQQLSQSSLISSISQKTELAEDSNTTHIGNSEQKFECWWIENPVSRELTKRITIKLGAKAEQEFVIVLKAPKNNLRNNMTELLSRMSLSLLSYQNEGFGVNCSFEEVLKTNYGGSMKEFLKNRKKLGQLQRAQILLAARVEIPRLLCLKALRHSDFNFELGTSQHQLIPILVKNDGIAHRFRIPFRYQGSQDIQLEFLFPQTSTPINQSNTIEVNKKPKSADSKNQQQLTPEALPFELQAQPSTMTVSGNQDTVLQLSLTAKYIHNSNNSSPRVLQNNGDFLKDSENKQFETLNKSKSVQSENHQHLRKGALNKSYYSLMVVRVKDTHIMYSFYIEVTLTDAKEQLQLLNGMASAGNTSEQ